VAAPAYAASPSPPAEAQSPAPASGSLVRGTVTAIAGNVLTVKDDQGAEQKITVPDSSKVLQLPAGSKSLSSATPIKFADIAVGDRILAGGPSKFDGSVLGVLESKRYGAAPVFGISSTKDDFHGTSRAGSNGSRKSCLRYGFEEGTFCSTLVSDNCNLWEL